MERTKNLEPLKTVVGQVTTKFKGESKTFSVVYGNVCYPLADGKLVKIPETSYISILAKFLDSPNGLEYVIPNKSEIEKVNEEVRKISLSAVTKQLMENFELKKQEEVIKELKEEIHCNEAKTAEKEEKIEETKPQKDEVKENQTNEEDLNTDEAVKHEEKPLEEPAKEENLASEETTEGNKEINVQEDSVNKTSDVVNEKEIEEHHNDLLSSNLNIEAKTDESEDKSYTANEEANNNVQEEISETNEKLAEEEDKEEIEEKTVENHNDNLDSFSPISLEPRADEYEEELKFNTTIKEDEEETVQETKTAEKTIEEDIDPNEDALVNEEEMVETRSSNSNNNDVVISKDSIETLTSIIRINVENVEALLRCNQNIFEKLMDNKENNPEDYAELKRLLDDLSIKCDEIKYKFNKLEADSEDCNDEIIAKLEDLDEKLKEFDTKIDNIGRPIVRLDPKETRELRSGVKTAKMFSLLTFLLAILIFLQNLGILDLGALL